MTLKTERTRVRRIPERGHYDKEIIYPIIDEALDRKSTRLNSSHKPISYAVFCLKKKTT